MIDNITFSLYIFLHYIFRFFLQTLHQSQAWSASTHFYRTRVRSLVMVKILKLKFGQYFAPDVWWRLRRWILVNILKLGLVKILTLDLVKMLMFGWDFEINAWSRFWYCNMFKIFELWIEILWYELNPRVRCAFGNVFCQEAKLPKTRKHQNCDVGTIARGLIGSFDHFQFRQYGE